MTEDSRICGRANDLAIVALDSGLVLGPFEARDAAEALKYVAGHLVRLGYARETYPDAVVSRETEYPTGLPTNGAGVAIPHCDGKHVLKPAIAVGTLASPVMFGVMGDKDSTVPVDIIVMLAIIDPASQIDVLRRVSLMVQDAMTLKELKSAPSRGEVMRILRRVFPE